MEEKAFIEKQRDTIESVEVELLAVVKKAKSDLDIEVNKLRQETDREIEKEREKYTNEEEKLNKTILDLRKKVDYYRNGVYEKYFDKVNATETTFNTSDTFSKVQSSLKSALSELEKYEDSVRLHKFLVDLFKQNIRNACRQALNALAKLNNYLDKVKKENEKKLMDLISDLKYRKLIDRENTLRSNTWKRLEGEIDKKLSDALSLIIGD